MIIYSTFFFFNDTATTEIYTLSLHDALPISQRPGRSARRLRRHGTCGAQGRPWRAGENLGRDREAALQCRRGAQDRKSTRLNSSHSQISYAVFCLKNKKTAHAHIRDTRDTYG